MKDGTPDGKVKFSLSSHAIFVVRRDLHTPRVSVVPSRFSISMRKSVHEGGSYTPAQYLRMIRGYGHDMIGFKTCLWFVLVCNKSIS